MIITAISPDKLSLSMFSDYCQKKILTDKLTNIIDINCLYSSEVQEGIIKDLLKDESRTHTLIKYKIKKQTKMESIPESVIKHSSYIIRFDLYSSHPEVIKSENGPFLDNLLMRWASSVEKMNV